MRNRSICASGSGKVPLNSIGLSVATRKNGSGRGRDSPSTVTWRSSSASSKLDCVRGVVRLISSARTTWAKIGPGMNSNFSWCWRYIETPVMSAGSRSGVNWIRRKLAKGMRVSAVKRAEWERLLEILCEYRLQVNGSEGFRVAEVTGGGIPLGDVHPSTLESRSTSGLYICGEMLDAIGRIGGFNFLWAWVTGRMAGESAARSVIGDK